MTQTKANAATQTTLTRGHEVSDQNIEYTALLWDGYPVAALTSTGAVYDICRRCGGSGHYSYNMSDGTMCYGCNGDGLGKRTTEADVIRRAVNRDKAKAAREAKEIKRQAAMKAAKDAQMAENVDLMNSLRPFLLEYGKADEGYSYPIIPAGQQGLTFLNEMADIAFTYAKPLTEKQLAAIPAAIERESGWNAERAEKIAAKVAIGHYGKVGEKIAVEVTVDKVIAIEGMYGTSWLCIMTGTEGHSFTSYSTGAFVTDAIAAEGKGTTVKIKATIKGHEDYQGTPQTKLTRIKSV